MSLTNKIQSIQFPDFQDVIKSGKNTKNKLDNKNANTVNVHFYYSDNRFKTTVLGTIDHSSGVPIIYIEYPEKLAYLVPDNSLVYDMKNQMFEVSVNEKYTHTINVVNCISKNEEEIVNYILPYLTDDYKYQVVELEGVKKNNNLKKGEKEEDKILLTSKMLSSLGRAKILERTVESNNDGLMVMAALGGLIGFVLGMVVGIKTVM